MEGWNGQKTDDMAGHVMDGRTRVLGAGWMDGLGVMGATVHKIHGLVRITPKYLLKIFLFYLYKYILKGSPEKNNVIVVLPTM